MPADLRTLDDLVDAVLMPGFDGLTAPDWVRRRVSGSLGGVCLFARNIADPEQLRTLTDELRAERGDVIVSADEEAGDVTRLDARSGARFPGSWALGLADDPDATRLIGQQVGTLLAGVGVTLNLAPSADVMIDPANPVIGTRSFGSDPALVARHTAAFIAGHQRAAVAACAKHFPGHGDTAVDSHLGTPVVEADRERLWTTELPPFRAAIDAGVAAVMTGHLSVPAVDPLPATISRRWLTDILRADMGFTGAVVTDALEMGAIARTCGVAEGAVLALAAGADLLCLGGQDSGEDLVDLVAAALTDAVRAGRLSEDRLVEAATRARMLAARPPNPPPPTVTVPAEPSRRIAAAALRINGPLPDLGVAPLIIRCQNTANIAVGAVPWGPATVWPAAREVLLLNGSDLPGGQLAEATGVVLVTRDRQRHEYMRRAERDLRALRPDAVLVEMGTGDPAAAPAVASGGATRVTSEVVAELLRHQ